MFEQEIEEGWSFIGELFRCSTNRGYHYSVTFWINEETAEETYVVLGAKMECFGAFDDFNEAFETAYDLAQVNSRRARPPYVTRGGNL